VRLAPEAAAGCGPSALRVVKTVDLLRATDEDTASRRIEALREAEVLKSLRHPNIIGYDDAFLADSHLCIVMEYADGGDLAVAIARRREAARRYHEREAMAIFAQLALALRHVHDLRILHRDVKSQNVFLTSGGVVKLGDFGVAKVLTASENCAGTRIGTPQCLPPELCENHPYDFKADVWGLGVILYQLLALECPFNGASIAALAVRICTAEPRPVPSVYSSEARMLLSRLLAKRAEDRPSSTEILAMPHVRRSVAALPGRPQCHQPQSARSIGRRSEASQRSTNFTRNESPAVTPRRIVRGRAVNALRRSATVPECGSPDLLPKPRRGRTSPSKAKASSPHKHRGSPKKCRDLGSPKKAARFGQVRQSLSALLPLADEDGTSPGSRDVSDLLASILESPLGGGCAGEEPAKSARSEGADTTSTACTRAATHDGLPSSRSIAGGSDPGHAMGQAAEDLATCTALLSALELEFGLA